MSERKRNGIVTIISGAVLILSGVSMLVFTVEPAWLPITVAIVSSIVTIIFGTKLVKG